MQEFINNHWKAIGVIVAIVMWITFCLECYCDKRDGIERPGTDTIDMGD